MKGRSTFVACAIITVLGCFQGNAMDEVPRNDETALLPIPSSGVLSALTQQLEEMRLKQQASGDAQKSGVFPDIQFILDGAVGDATDLNTVPSQQRRRRGYTPPLSTSPGAAPIAWAAHVPPAISHDFHDEGELEQLRASLNYVGQELKGSQPFCHGMFRTYLENVRIMNGWIGLLIQERDPILITYSNILEPPESLRNDEEALALLRQLARVLEDDHFVMPVGSLEKIIFVRAALSGDIPWLLQAHEQMSSEDLRRLVIYPPQVRRFAFERLVARGRIFVAQTGMGDIVSFTKIFRYTQLEHSDEFFSILCDELGCLKRLDESRYRVGTLWPEEVATYTTTFNPQFYRGSDTDWKILVNKGMTTCPIHFLEEGVQAIYFGTYFCKEGYRNKGIATIVRKFGLERVMQQLIKIISESKVACRSILFTFGKVVEQDDALQVIKGIRDEGAAYAFKCAVQKAFRKKPGQVGIFSFWPFKTMKPNPQWDGSAVIWSSSGIQGRGCVIEWKVDCSAHVVSLPQSDLTRASTPPTPIPNVVKRNGFGFLQ